MVRIYNWGKKVATANTLKEACEEWMSRDVQLFCMTVDYYVKKTGDKPEEGTEDAFDDFLDRFYAWFRSLNGDQAFELLRDGDFTNWYEETEEK